MTRLRRTSAGLTATELVVVTAIFVILSMMVYATVSYQAHTYRMQTAQVSSQTKLRYWMSQMVKDIRRAGFDPYETGSFGLTVFQPTEIQFTTDLDGNGTLDAGAETRGYRFAGDTVSVLRGGSWRPFLTGVAGFQLVYRNPQDELVVNASSDTVSSVEIALSAEASTQTFEGRTKTTTHSPTIVVGTGTTTVDAAPSAGTSPVLAQIERARLRNFR